MYRRMLYNDYMIPLSLSLSIYIYIYIYRRRRSPRLSRSGGAGTGAVNPRTESPQTTMDLSCSAKLPIGPRNSALRNQASDRGEALKSRFSVRKRKETNT